MIEHAAATTLKEKRKWSDVIKSVLEHTIIEFFEVGGFVIISAGIAALLQTAVPASLLLPIGEHPVWSVVSMMILSILFSLCSGADAFVARSLAGLTTPGGVVGFLVIGQMIDIRNLFLIPRSFPRWAVRIIFTLSFIFTLGIGIWVNFR